MKKSFSILSVIFIAVIFFFSNFLFVSAATVSSQTTEKVTLENPINASTAPQFIGTVIKGFIGILGAVVLFMFLLGGFEWLTAGGNAEKVKKGTETMLWATIGTVIIFSSYFLISAWLKGILGG
ncbi:MAG: hypothetical protein WCT40_01845 [Candidatus Magasanikbacteria bacterium]|jgi:hypothetical protein